MIFLTEDNKNTKPKIHSRILWVNIIALLAFLLQMFTGEIVDMEAQVGVLAIINIILRLVTNQGLE